VDLIKGGSVHLSQVSGGAAIFAVAVSIASATASWRISRESGRQTELAESAAQVNTVIHFTSRFLDLVEDGMNFDNTTWAMKYWRLQATEFYFYVHGWLPQFIYQIWMSELADVYQNVPDAWPTNAEYLRLYAQNNAEMCAFFEGLASMGPATPQREEVIQAHVAGVKIKSVPKPRKGSGLVPRLSR
jgi:hypothetical protein